MHIQEYKLFKIKFCSIQTTKRSTTTERSRLPPNKLPGGPQLPLPTMKPALRKNFVEEEIKRVAINMDTKNQNDPWVVAKDWLKPRSVYPAKHQALGSILHALTTTKVNLINYTFDRI